MAFFLFLMPIIIFIPNTYDIEGFMHSFFNNMEVLCFAFPKVNNIITYSL